MAAARRLLVPLLVFLLAAAGTTPGALPAQAVPPQKPAVLRPGDKFDLTVWRNPEFSGTFTVARDEGVFHPILRNVKVGGLPFDAAQENLRAFLQQYESEPRFVFQPELRVYVGGRVPNPNQFYFPEISVSEAIVNAGGSTTPDSHRRIKVIRDGVETVANLTDGQADALLQSPIRSGDQILVEDRPSFTRSYVEPALRVVQTVTGLVATYVYLRVVLTK